MISDEDTRQQPADSYIHVGNSMVPTLKALDRVYVSQGGRFGRGDVILFTEPATGRKIAHRVLSIGEDGIITRGDNNVRPDSLVVRPENVLGRVLYARRGGKNIPVRGGKPGLTAIIPHRALMRVCQGLSVVAVVPYHALARSGLFRLWLPQSMRPHVISFSGSEGPELQVIVGKRVAGRWQPGLAGWQIRPPYKLFVDERSLPHAPACSGSCRTRGES